MSRKRLVAVETEEAEGLWDAAHVIRCDVFDDFTNISVYSAVHASCEFPVPQGSEARARFEANKEKSCERERLEIPRTAKTWEEAVVEKVGELLEENENFIRRQLEAFHFEKCVTMMQAGSSSMSNHVAHPIFATLNKD